MRFTFPSSRVCVIVVTFSLYQRALGVVATRSTLECDNIFPIIFVFSRVSCSCPRRYQLSQRVSDSVSLLHSRETEFAPWSPLKNSNFKSATSTGFLLLLFIFPFRLLQPSTPPCSPIILQASSWRDNPRFPLVLGPLSRSYFSLSRSALFKSFYRRDQYLLWSLFFQVRHRNKSFLFIIRKW